MRLLFVILTILGVAYTKSVFNLHEGEDVAKQFIECVRLALDGGLASAEIPNHNPFKITRNLTFPFEIDIFSGVLKLENVEIDHIVDVKVQDVVGEITENEAIYNVTFLYDDLTTRGDYNLQVKILGFPLELIGTWSIALQDLVIDLSWDQDNSTRLLVDFPIKVNVGTVAVNVDALGDDVTDVVGLTLKEVINFADYNSVAEGLLNRLNSLWLDNDHWYRIDAILENCQKAP